jgi:hypothetical protein
MIPADCFSNPTRAPEALKRDTEFFSASEGFVPYMLYIPAEKSCAFPLQARQDALRTD